MIIDDKYQKYPIFENIDSLYILPKDDLINKALIPLFTYADSVDCMMGFFTSSGLSAIAPGLAAFINNSTNSLRLIISPNIQSDDYNAMRDDVNLTEDMISKILINEEITASAIEKYTLECLTYLLKTGRIEIKIAFMNNSTFHMKTWHFYFEEKSVVLHGSANFTAGGTGKNIEQVSVSKSWKDESQKKNVEKLARQFTSLWNDSESDECIVVPLSDAIKKNLIKVYGRNNTPTEDEYQTLLKEELFSNTDTMTKKERQSFHIPEYLEYETGPYQHQGEAVRAWIESDYKGILEMATGSGKTITSMICAYKLFEVNKPLLVVVSAPYRPLINQWCQEIKEFGIIPVNIGELNGPKNRAKYLQKLNRRFRHSGAEIEILVVSHTTLTSEEFQNNLSKIQCKKLLIADEAHNLGSEGFVKNKPEFFDYRIGLSATPIRQYDEEGTVELFDYFGPIVYQYTLEEAIGKCLVEYEYYVHPVYLEETEMEDWYSITELIKKNVYRIEDGKSDKYLSKLFRDRRLILETAKNKIKLLAELLDKENHKDIQYTLIYASDKAPEQIREVNSLLNKRRINFHQLTADETNDQRLTKTIIDNFQSAIYKVITAKRVLDEGVNIPQIEKAFILASTTVERQWVQRRGRLLRTCSATGKKKSVIHDFIALPPFQIENLDVDAKSLIRSELNRVKEFAKLSMNAGRNDGPLHIVHELTKKLYF